MALPYDLNGLLEISNVGWRGSAVGPFKVGSAYYIVGKASANTHQAVVLRATDPSSSWTEQDSSNRPSTAGTGFGIGGIAAVVDGTTIHIVTVRAAPTNGYIYYHTFNTSTNQWGTTDDAIQTSQDFTGGSSIPGIGVRSDGTIVISSQGPDETIMGTGRGRCIVSYGTAGSWTTDVRVDNQGKVDANLVGYGGEMAYPQTTPSDNFHVIYHDDGDTDILLSVFRDTDDFAASGQDIVVEAAPNETGLRYQVKLISFDNSGTTKFRQILSDTDYNLNVYGWDDGDAPSVSEVATAINDSAMSSTSAAIIVADGSTQHAFFTYTTTPSTIRHDETGSGNDTWGTDDNAQSFTNFTRPMDARSLSGDSAIGLIYIDTTDGHEYYDEYSLSSTITGTASQTSTVPTQSASGTMQPEGTAAQTVSTPSQVASGSHTENATGTAAQTVSTPTQSSTGGLTIAGTASQTVDFFSQAASGLLTISGAVAQAVDTPSQTASGTQTISGTATQTVATPSQAAAGIMQPSGTAAQTVATPTQVADGTHTEQNATGTAAQTVSTPTQSASGALKFIGTAAQTVGTPSQVASGTQTISGTASQAAIEPTQSASGTQTISGTATQTVATPSQAADGIMQPSGTASQTVATPTQDASGSSQVNITGTMTGLVLELDGLAPFVSSDATGVMQPSGTAVQTVDTPTQLAAGTQTISGSASQSALLPSQSLSGGLTISGSAAQTTTAPTQAVTGYMRPEGAAAQTVSTPTQIAAGTHTQQNASGTAAQSAFVPSQDVSGVMQPSGTAVQTVDTPAQLAAGTQTISGTMTGLVLELDGLAPFVSSAASGVLVLTGTIAQGAFTPSQTATGQLPIFGTTGQTTPTPSQSLSGGLEIIGSAAQTILTPTQALAGFLLPEGGIVQEAFVPTQDGTGGTSEGDIDQLVPTPSQLMGGGFMSLTPTGGMALGYTRIL